MKYDRECQIETGACGRSDGEMIADFDSLGVGIARGVSQEQLPIVESDMRWLQCGGWDVDGCG